MVTTHQIKHGAANFIDHEIMPKIDGWKKWIAGAVVAEYLDKADDIIEILIKSPAISVLGIVDENKHVDIERLRDRFLEQARKTGAVNIDIPMLGSLRVDESDIHKLYKYITEA